MDFGRKFQDGRQIYENFTFLLMVVSWMSLKRLIIVFGGRRIQIYATEMYY